jgi:hypothetical protein
LTTITFDISDSNQQESRWAIFTPDDKGQLRHLGQINKIAASLVPDRCHQDLRSPRRNALYVSSKGHWARTLEDAADLLATKPCDEFIATGALLDLFTFIELADKQLKNRSDYRVYRDSEGFWSAEELVEPVEINKAYDQQ